MADEIQSQSIDLVFAGGVDKKTHKHVVAQPKLTRLENRVFKGGLLARRPGYRRLYGPGDDSALKRLGSDAMLGVFKNQLVARDKTRVFPWSDSTSGFLPGGVTNEVTGSVFSSSLIADVDRVSPGTASEVASNGGVEAYVWRLGNKLYCRVVGSDGVSVVPPTLLGTKVAQTFFQFRDTLLPVRVVATSYGFMFVYIVGTQLKARALSSATWLFGEEATIESSTDYYYNVDCAPTPSGGVAVMAFRCSSSGSGANRTIRALTLNPSSSAVVSSVTVATYGPSSAPGSSSAIVGELQSISASEDGSIFVFYSVENGLGDITVRGTVYGPTLSVLTANAEVLAFSSFLLTGIGSSSSGESAVVLSVSVGMSDGLRVYIGTVPKTLPEGIAYFSAPMGGTLASKPFNLGPNYYDCVAIRISNQAVLVVNEAGSVISRIPSSSLSESIGSVVFGDESAKFTVGINGVVSAISLAFDTLEGDERLVPYEHHGSLYFPGAITRAFDGQTLHEVGFNKYFDTDSFSVADVGSGTLPAGSYITAIIASWTDASGEVWRSAPQFDTVTVGASGKLRWTITGKILSDKPNVVYELYRSPVVLGIDSAILYKLSASLSDAVLTVDESETGIESNESEYTVGGSVVEGIAPPSCKHISEHGQRLVLSGTPDGNVWYSQKYVEGVAPRFNEDFILSASGQGGKVVATASMDGRLYLICERDVEYVTGDGPSETFQGGGFSDPQVVTFETGCRRPQSVRLVPQGIMFQGDNGVYLIGRSGQSGYIGSDVEALTSAVQSIIHVPRSEEVRVAQSNPDSCLGFSTTSSQWTTATPQEIASAVLWKDRFTWADTSTGVTSIFVEDYGSVSDNGEPIVSVVETAWLRLNTLAGFQRVWWVYFLGTYQGPSTITVDVGYNESDDYAETVRCFTGDMNLTPGQPIPFKWKPRLQKCRSIRFRISCDGGGDEPSGGCDLTGLTLEMGVKRGLFKLKRVETLGVSRGSESP